MANCEKSSSISKTTQSIRKRKRTKTATKTQQKNINQIQTLNSDISEDEGDESVRTKRQRVSVVHAYATKQSESEYKCNTCLKVIRCGVGTNANIRRHLAVVHGFTNLKSKSHVLRNNGRIDPARKKAYDNVAIRAIIVDGRPFSDFRKKGMASFLSVLSPGYVGPHEKTVQRAMKRLYGEKLADLKNQLKHIHWVTLTTDLWRRPTKDSYLCITIHYIDRDYTNVSKVLSFQRFHGRHLAKRLRIHLIRVIKRFDLQSKIIATVTDNGSDVRLATQQQEIFGIRLHCIGHGLNLTVKNGLGLWKQLKEKKKLTPDYKEILHSPCSLDESMVDDTQEQDRQTQNQTFDFDCVSEGDEGDDDDDENEETDQQTIEQRQLSTNDSNGATGSDTVAENIELADDDSDELPRDESEVILFDEETDESEDESTDHSFFIENINPTLSKCRHLINVINKSIILYETIQSLAKPTVKVDLVIDMIVRWNSTYKMLSNFLQYQYILPGFIEQISTNKTIPVRKLNLMIKLQPTGVEWEILRTLFECLSRFADATEMLSGSNYPSFALSYVVLKSLQHYLIDESSNEMEMVIKAALRQKLEFYMKHQNDSEEHKLLLMCSYLDPMVHTCMNKDDIVLTRELLTIEWNRICDIDTNVNSDDSFSTTSSFSTEKSGTEFKPSVSTAEKLKVFKERCGIIDNVSNPILSKDLSIKREFSRFEEFDKKDSTFASFWQRYESSLPILSKMARRYGAIPGTSVPSESIFSVAGYVARKTRSSLTAKSLKYSIFLKDKL